MCVDQTKTVFLQDCLELIDKADEHYIDHELLTPHILNKTAPDQQKVFKLVGNIVVPGKHVVKIQLDKKFQAAYDEHTVRKLPLKKENK